jgi:hypothetical protein
VKNAPAVGLGVRFGYMYIYRERIIFLYQLYQMFQVLNVVTKTAGKEGMLDMNPCFLHEGNVAIITLPIPWYTPRNRAGFGFPVCGFVYTLA